MFSRPPSPLTFWAKLGCATWPEQYHPVICHLIDVAAVTQALWDGVLRRRIRQWLARRLGFDEEAACARWLAFWSGAHDIGKVSPCFQDRGKNTAELRRLLEPEFNFPVGDQPHGTLSTKILTDELASATKWPAIDPAVARNVAVAVGGHHGVFPSNWDGICSPLGNEKWTTARRALLAELARLCGVTNLRPPNPTPRDDQSIWMYVAGLTSVADWIGSNQEFFPPVGNEALVDGRFNVDEYFDKANCQAKEALEMLGWNGRADTTTPVTFAKLFPFKPRLLQTAVEEIVVRMTEPSLLIVEAPMGEGKTEAGWYAAACWDRQGGQGAYVALPTMATSNQMFERVGKFLEADAGKKNLMLQHGKAALNDWFEKLKYAAQVYDDEKRPSAVVAEGWFAANKKHGLLAPYGVGTIDQALLAVLQTKHLFVRLFGLAGKCVILDEVHAYDAYMTTLMERLLRWLAALGCPVVLLSATLPREKRVKLLRAYAGDGVAEPEHVDYPRVTTVTVGGPVEVKHFEADPTRARTVQLDWLDEGGLANKLRTSLANGGCAAVIRNTGGLAQETYRQLRDALKEDGITVELFHARFPFGRRKQIEDDVLRWYGRTNDDVMSDDGRIVSAPHRPAKSVLVATQVVEQSLDLDFDVMVSDVAPVDLVLQRAGRLHRHKRGARPEGVNEPRVWLIEPEVKEGLPDFGRSEYVYARFVLLRSHLALKSVEAIQLPDDLERFVEQVYGTVPLAIPDGWQAALAESEKKLREKQENQQLDALDVAINDSDQSPLEQQSQQLEEDDPEAAKKIQVQTRDSDPSIQIVIIYELAGLDYLDATGLEPFDEADKPDFERVRRLLNNEVTISHSGCRAHYGMVQSWVTLPDQLGFPELSLFARICRAEPSIPAWRGRAAYGPYCYPRASIFEPGPHYAGRSVPKGWRYNGMLRHHRAVRVDEDGKSLPGDFFLWVDHELGVMFRDF